MVKTAKSSFIHLILIMTCVMVAIAIQVLHQNRDVIASQGANDESVNADMQMLAEVRVDKLRLEKQLVATQNRVAVSDPSLAEALDQMIGFYRNKLAPAVVRFNQNGERIYTAQDRCVAPPCAHFVIADLGGLHNVIGLWNPERQDLVIDPSLNFDDPLLPFVIFHELFHALDPVVAEQLQTLRDADQNLITQAETRAFNFGSVVLGAATGGAYNHLVQKTAHEILKAKREQVPVGKAVGFAIPETLGRVFGDRRQLSQRGLDTLVFVFMYDVNRVIIMETNSTDKHTALAQNYANVIKLNTDPRARALINRSLNWWLQAHRR